jgi:hypothetical protein
MSAAASKVLARDFKTLSPGEPPPAPEGCAPGGTVVCGYYAAVGLAPLGQLAALTAVYGQPTPFAGPRNASAVPGGGAAGALSATVSFAAPSAASPGNDGPLRLISPSPDGPFANSSVCPTGVAADLCAGFALRGSDNVWYAAVAALGAAPRTLVLTASAADVPAGLTATATASGWSLWPITLLYSSGGLPAWPWNASVAPAAAAGE